MLLDRGLAPSELLERRGLVGEAAGHRAAVDDQARAVDVGGLVRDEERDRGRQLRAARATRPIGASSPSMRSASSRVMSAGSSESVIGVATVPGSTVLQRMPWWA